MGTKPKRKRSLLKSLFFLLFIVLLLCLAAASFFPGLLFLPLYDPAAVIRGGALSGDTINIVLLGFDASAARGENSLYRPDTILVAAFDFRAAEISMVSIPRDSYVKIHGQDTFDKINHSYMYGYYSAREGEDPDQKGISTTLLTIGDFLGDVPLHGYIRVDMDGAAAIVDSVGGVYIDVEEDFRSDYGRGSVIIEEGYQRLDGNKFMHYVRNRADYLGGERGRTIRQQQALAALLDQQKSLRGLVRTPALFMAVNKHVETDLNLLQLTALGLTGLRAGAETAGTHVFSGRGQLSYRGGQNIYYLVIDEEKRVEIIKAVFGIDVAKREQITLPGPQVSEPEQVVEEIPIEPVPEEPPAEPEPVPVPEPEPDPDPEPEPEPDPEPEPENEPEPEPGPEQEPENEAESG